MHLPKVKAFTALILIAWVLLSVLGCAQKSAAPAVPTDVQVMDIPADDGTSVILSWRHYKASLARQYEVYYSTVKDSLENESLLKELTPITRTVQASVPAIGDTAAENVQNLDYYLLLEEGETGVPQITIVKATDENRDSLKQFGEKILRAENNVFPESKSTVPTKFAKGTYYRVMSPSGGESVKKTIEKSKIVSDSTGYKISEGIGSIILDVELSAKERAFRDAGDRIVEYDPDMSDYLVKYGGKIAAVVTEKYRYALDSDMIQTVIHGDLEAGKTYFYRVVADDAKGNTAQTEIMDFTPQDEPPMKAANTSAQFDSSKGEVLFSWLGYNPGLASFRDVRKYEIHRYDEGDTLLSGGELLGTFGADFGKAMIAGDFTEDDMFYIASFDNSGQRSACEPFGLVLAEFNPPELVESIEVVDLENDDGSALAVRWGEPEIALNISVTDPSPKYRDRKLPDNYYLVETENGQMLQQFEPSDTSIPDNAMRVIGAKELELPDSYNVTVSYRIFANKSQNAEYAKLKLDDGKFEKDLNGTGSFKFEGLAAGEHTFEAVLLNSSGNELKNKKARITKRFVLNEPGRFRDKKPPEIIQTWRGNPEIVRKNGVLLAGVPDFDPKNKNTFELTGQSSLLDRQHRDAFPDSLRDVGDYYYFVREIGPDGSYVESDIFGPITPRSQIFHTGKTMVFIFIILFAVFANLFISWARRGKHFYLRPIAGIVHLDEALGRATEMGRPILYVLGLTGIGDIATLAGLTILGRVAKKAAEFQTRIIVPCVNPIVLIVAQETVKSACLDAGHPELYSESDVFYAAGSQFSYAAAVAGLMVRYKTAANFYMGMFFAESLILTETGSMTGAIQIAGTDAVTQIPFFITTCDYTLIGEELYAASAYLSQDPLQVGTLKAQDTLKAIYMVLIITGTVAMTSGFLWFVNLFKVQLGQ